MAYFTGRDVSVWVTTEHLSDGIKFNQESSKNSGELAVRVGIDFVVAPSVANLAETIIPSLPNAGMTPWALSDITGVDVSIGSQDEDISFMGLRNVGKIEVKKDTSISITRKKSDAKFSMLFQGKTEPTESNTTDGLHSARYGLIKSTGASTMAIADGTVDPKSTKGDMAGGSNQSFGYRVFVELKPEAVAGDGTGEVLVIPNCHFMEYSHTLSNESANEESFTLQSQVKPFIWNGTKADYTGGVYGYNGKAKTCTLTADM